jgi:DNA-binding CsgD family transcriptional regulator
MTKNKKLASERHDNNKAQIELSKLETALLEGICQGLSSTELAGFVHKSPRTVEGYRKSLYMKFNVQNKEQLIVKAVALKVIHLKTF